MRYRSHFKRNLRALLFAVIGVTLIILSSFALMDIVSLGIIMLLVGCMLLGYAVYLKNENIITSIVIALAISALAFYTKSNLLKWISALSWIFADYFIYRKAFQATNKLDLSNDLAFFGIRILGGIISFVGLFFGILFLVAGLVIGGDPLSVGFGIIMLGLAVLGAFIAFRTQRRYPHLYINR